VQRGSGATVDVLLAKSRLQRARELRVSFAGALKRAIAGYRELFAVPPEVGSMETPPVPEDLLPSSLDDALATAATDNLVLRTRRVQVDVADRQRTVAASPYYPRVDIVGSANWEKNIDAERGIRRDYTILLQSTWQFFTGFRTQADVAAASLNSAASRDDVDNAVRDVRQQVKDSWEELQTARERVELLRNAVSISEEVFEARSRLREAGRETAINVLDAETETFSARINLVSAEFDARLSSYRLLFVMGRLTPAQLSLVVVDPVAD